MAAPPPDATTVPGSGLPYRIPPPSRQRTLRERLFKAGMLVCLSVGLITLGVLTGDVLVDGIGDITPSFFTNGSSSTAANSGIEPAIYGTLWVMVVCAAFIIPVGVATAVYLEEYADRDRWYNRLIEVNIQNLAAVPSIIYGILGLAFLVRGPLNLGRVVLAGGLTLGLLVLPVVIVTGREAIRAVPPSIREGSMALGATKWQTIWKQVLPASIPGIATGVILAISRAIGETAPLILVGAATYISFNPDSINSEFTVIPLVIFNWISNPDPDFKSLAAAAIIVLLAVLLALNALAIWLRNRYEQKW